MRKRERELKEGERNQELERIATAKMGEQKQELSNSKTGPRIKGLETNDSKNEKRRGDSEDDMKQGRRRKINKKWTMSRCMAL